MNPSCPVALQTPQPDYPLFDRERAATRLLRWRLQRLGNRAPVDLLRQIETKLAALAAVPAPLADVQRFRFLDASDCARVITGANLHAAEHGWTRQRHGNFPTCDLRIVDIPALASWLVPRIDTALLPWLGQRFGLDAYALELLDLFVVSYRLGEQSALAPHEDDSLLSFSISLSEPGAFDGGGLRLVRPDETVHTALGEGIAHAGKWLHEGLPITSGRRILLVGFIGSRGFDHRALADIDCALG